jgi:hypothetical protein
MVVPPKLRHAFVPSHADSSNGPWQQVCPAAPHAALQCRFVSQ